jgi:hypothetical protein
MDVDESGDGLHWAAMLTMVEEVLQTRLKLGAPVEYVELGFLKGMVERHGHCWQNSRMIVLGQLSMLMKTIPVALEEEAGSPYSQ